MGESCLPETHVGSRARSCKPRNTSVSSQTRGVVHTPCGLTALVRRRHVVYLKSLWSRLTTENSSDGKRACCGVYVTGREG